MGKKRAKAEADSIETKKVKVKNERLGSYLTNY